MIFVPHSSRSCIFTNVSGVEGRVNVPSFPMGEKMSLEPFFSHGTVYR
jgi:hypothetical protein